MKRFTKIKALFMAAVLMFMSMGNLVGCTREVIDNETTRLVIATAALDGVFNPFFSTSATDGNIVGMTQLPMFTTDKDGKIAYGEDEACVVLDYDTSTDTVGGKKYTTYRFVLKNNLKFSDGVPLTINDVLFNMYVYLDPVYTGASTMYSTDIVGLSAYRTQTENETQWDNFDEQFDDAAAGRLDRLLDTLSDIYEEYRLTSLTEEVLLAALQAEIDINREYAEAVPEGNEAEKEYYESYFTLIEDYQLAKKLFKEELQSIWNTSKGTAEEISFKDGKVHLTTDAEAFLYNCGYITWDEKANNEEGGFDYKLSESSKNWSEAQCIDAVFKSYFPGNVNNVFYEGYNTYYDISTAFAAEEKHKYFEGLEGDGIASISGITYANYDQAVTVNNKEYGVPTLNADGSVKSGNQVLQIVINNVDPKAIWNFGFSVAPMHYYSSKELTESFDYANNKFGVSYADPNFMNNEVRNSDKMGVPVGAGPYKATTRSGDSSKVSKGTFYENNMVYFERNEYFEFPAKIKYVNYKVVDTKFILDALKEGDIHFGEPASKQESIDELNKILSDGFGYNEITTNGYGYIGINAADIPDVNVRRAIMHAIDTQLCLDYYVGHAKPIYRPMTRQSWAYPTATDSEGQYYKFDETGKTSEDLVKEAGYTLGSDGVYVNPTTGDKLEYIFTIAGDSEDHPAYNALKKAADILNKHGFKVTVQKDINALKKLNNGALTVWAAAWGSTIDPDMYQTYHIDSLAGSTANWGYRAIRLDKGNGKYEFEWGVVQDLSDIIDAARETLDQKERTAFYAEALDLVMELAVELPTYQRNDLFAYNTKVIDQSSLIPESELTSYNGPLSKLWEVSFNETN